MKEIISAYAPANISCIFKIYFQKDPASMGSYGLGFTLNKGVSVRVSHSAKTTVVFNSRSIFFPTVLTVLELLTAQQLQVEINTRFPLGGGYGISGASALACAYGINKLLNLEKDSLELAKIAHTAEVMNKTGLGDVTNQYFGGCLLKTEPSSAFIGKRLPFEHTPVYCKFFSELSTQSILSDQVKLDTISRAADISLQEITTKLNSVSGPSFQDIIRISKEFAFRSGLLQDQTVRETIEDIEQHGGHASMILLGNGVFSDIPFPSAVKYSISTQKADII